MNSNLSTAFFGAVAGSLTIILIDWFGRQRRILADINASIGVLSGLLNTYLNIKRQHAVPLAITHDQNRTIFKLRKSSDASKNIRFYFNLKQFHCPTLHFDIPLDRIFTLTDKYPKIVEILTQAKRSMGEVQESCHLWNQLAESIQKIPDSEKQAFFEDALSPEETGNSMYEDTILNLKKSVDDALFFTNRAIKTLTMTGKSALPFWLNRRVITIQILDKEHADLMPPENYKEGWDG